MEGRSLSVGYIPTQWTLATGKGDGDGRNITYTTMGNEEPVLTQNLEPGWLDVWFTRKMVILRRHGHVKLTEEKKVNAMK